MVCYVKILIATYYYHALTGSELFAFTLAECLTLKGHSVCLYSPHIGGIITQQTRKLSIPVYDDLLKLRQEKFDIIHASHNITACETRYCFQHTPMVFLSHGVAPALEQPPIHDLNISKFLAVTEEVRDNLLRKGITRRETAIFRNIVNTDRFAPTQPLNSRPKKALIFSRKFDEVTKCAIQQACTLKRIEVEIVNDTVFDVETYMNQVDIIFTRGRGAIEAMATGRIVIIPGDGLVTEKNFKEIQKCNFSGRRFHKNPNVTFFKDAIEKYDSTLGENNRSIALKYFSADLRVQKLIDIYRQVIHTYEDEVLDVNELTDIAGARMELTEIKHSISYKFMKFCASHIDKLFPDKTSRGNLRKNVISKLQNYDLKEKSS